MNHDKDDVRDCLCLNTRKAARHLSQIYDDALRPSGLRITQFQLLSAIEKAEPVTQNGLSEILGTDRTTLTRNIGVVHRLGLVDIQQGVADRREQVHRLTKAGRAAVSAAMPLWRVAQKRASAQLVAGRQGTSTTAVLGILGRLSALSGEEQG